MANYRSLNTTGMANYRVQLAVPPSIKNVTIIIMVILFLKKVNTKKLGIFN